MASEKFHIMLFPWLAFGHMIPFLELSKKLAAKGILVSYVSTPKNLQRLPPIPSNLEAKISLVEIPMPQVDGLPENCEATIDLKQDQIQYLKKAYDRLAEPFEDLILQKGIIPDLILTDFAPYWIPDIAAKFGVPTAFFSVYTAATLAYLGSPDELKSGNRRPSSEHFTRPSDWIPFPSLVAHRPDYAPIMMRNTHVPDASGVSSGQRIGKILEQCSFVAVRSSEDFEGEYIRLVQELYQKPVLPVGVFPPIPEEKNKSDKKINSLWSNTFKWLDGQKPKSVVFVGFGSEYKMPIEQIHELAFALELSRLPFVWILRQPAGTNHSDLLPPGFATRTLNQGTVILGWAPQIEILAHSSIGGCLFHSGWGTIVEALGFGHALILLPMVSDQGLNAKLLVEKEIGYEIPRNEDGSFDRETVGKSMRLVMVEPVGEKLRLKAAQMRRVFDSQESQETCINNFIEHLEKCKDLKVRKQD